MDAYIDYISRKPQVPMPSIQNYLLFANVAVALKCEILLPALSQCSWPF